MTKRKLTPTRLRERMLDDREAVNRLLDEVLLGYVGLSLADGPVVMPVSYARQGDRLLMHGSTGSHRMRALAEGADICFTVATVDALKVARSAFGTGMRYRSVCIFGTCELLAGEDKRTALDAYTDRYLPGRTAEVRQVRGKELAATMVLALPITTWSMKVADGFPNDDLDDVAGDAWAGVVPVINTYGQPISAPDLRPGIEVPASVLKLG